jgi:hypothetical protein
MLLHPGSAQPGFRFQAKRGDRSCHVQPSEVSICPSCSVLSRAHSSNGMSTRLGGSPLGTFPTSLHSLDTSRPCIR